MLLSIFHPPACSVSGHVPWLLPNLCLPCMCTCRLICPQQRQSPTGGLQIANPMQTHHNDRNGMNRVFIALLNIIRWYTDLSALQAWRQSIRKMQPVEACQWRTLPSQGSALQTRFAEIQLMDARAKQWRQFSPRPRFANPPSRQHRVVRAAINDSTAQQQPSGVHTVLNSTSALSCGGCCPVNQGYDG